MPYNNLGTDESQTVIMPIMAFIINEVYTEMEHETVSVIRFTVKHN